MSDDRLKRIEDKVDKVVDQISEVNITLAKQHVSLKEHIRRTALLEDKMEPIDRHVKMVNGAVKLLLIISALAGIYMVFK